MIRGWLAGTRTDRAALLTAGLVVLAVVAAPPQLAAGLPVPLQTVWFVHLALVTCAVLPVIPTYALLDTTFPRARTDRALRAGVATMLLTAGVAAVHVRTGAPAYIALWSALMGALGLAAAAWRPGLAWAAVLLVGTATIAWQHTDLSNPMARALPPSVAPWAALAYVVAATAYTLAAANPSSR